MGFNAQQSVGAALASKVDQSHFQIHEHGVPDHLVDDWFGFLSKLKKKYGPVALTDGGVIEGLDLGRAWFTEGGRPIYVALSFAAVSEVVRNSAKKFGQALGPSLINVMGEVPLTLDPPQHNGYRALVDKALTRPALLRMEDEIIGPACEELARRLMEGKDTADLVTEYTGVIPFIVLANLMDIPSSDFRHAIEETNDLMLFAENQPVAQAASKRLGEYFGKMYDERVNSPGEDLISSLASAEIDGERLSKEQVISFCRMLLPGGMETTTKAFGQLMATLMRYPDQWDELKARPDLVPNAIDEILRWDAPITFMPKLARETTVVEGVEIPEGALVYVFHGGFAGRDEARWENPDKFDVTRPRKGTVAFGGGPHFCPGASLAKKEMEVGLETLLRTVPTMRADPDYPLPEIVGARQRSCSTIRVRF